MSHNFSLFKTQFVAKWKSILLLCNDNPTEVSRNARFCTIFIFENNLGRTQTAYESHWFSFTKYLKT